jgi:hypothetical protein
MVLNISGIWNAWHKPMLSAGINPLIAVANESYLEISLNGFTTSMPE